jgi:hypothetical protein
MIKDIFFHPLDKIELLMFIYNMFNAGIRVFVSIANLRCCSGFSVWFFLFCWVLGLFWWVFLCLLFFWFLQLVPVLFFDLVVFPWSWSLFCYHVIWVVWSKINGLNTLLRANICFLYNKESKFKVGKHTLWINASHNFQS